MATPRKSKSGSAEEDKRIAIEFKNKQDKFAKVLRLFFCIIKPPLDANGLRAKSLRRFIDEHKIDTT